jgi:hypothetical protein
MSGGMMIAVVDAKARPGRRRTPSNRFNDAGLGSKAAAPIEQPERDIVAMSVAPLQRRSV